MHDLIDGKMTGKLNQDCTLAEIYVLSAQPTGEPKVLGTRWVPLTQKMRDEIIATSVSILSGGVCVTTEMANDVISHANKLPADLPIHGANFSWSSSAISEKEAAKYDAALALEETPEEAEEFNRLARPSREAEMVALIFPTTADNGCTPNAPEPVHTRRVGEHSGHNVNYYCVPITHPKRPERAPYIFEVEDLIQALNLNFHEGTVLKSLVRAATERELGLVKHGGDAIRDAEKMVHSSQELLRDRKLHREEKSNG